MYSNILVAYDGSQSADKTVDRAMDIAMELAAKFDAEVPLIQIVAQADASSGRSGAEPIGLHR
jgi:nucleotide-binding universal stress UspA family protein